MARVRAATQQKSPKVPRGGDPADRCDLEFTADLSAVNLTVLRTLSAGAVLNVDRASVGNLEAAVCKGPKGDVVGTLAAIEGLAVLLDCLRRGVVYSAKIVRIHGATCTVHVRRTDK